MKYIKTIINIVLLLLALGGLQAQETLNSSGGVATGVGGMASYSVGQVFYTTNTGNTGSMAEGVQQPYEISEIIGIDETSIPLEISIYPNPTSNYLTLTSYNADQLSYQLYDIQGRLIVAENIAINKTHINMESLPAATYFLKITKTAQLIKTYKIIKN